MQSRRKMVYQPAWWLGAILLAPGLAQAQKGLEPSLPPLSTKPNPMGPSKKTAVGIAIPLEQLPHAVQAKARSRSRLLVVAMAAPLMPRTLLALSSTRSSVLT